MATTVTRAAQNSYPNTVSGGTQDMWTDARNITTFMDAVEREDTTFLNGIKKGKAGSDRREHSAIHSVTPRGSRMSGAFTNSATSLPVLAGHGARFQQGHVLMLQNAGGDKEIVWVTADPTASAMDVKRGQGGTTPLTGALNDKVTIIGTALPQLADFPMGPVTRGRSWWNTFQKFGTHLVYSDEARKTSTDEYPSGDQLDRDMLQKGKDLKMDLNMALVNGRRQEGSPNPADPVPSMFGGLQYWAEQSGNVFTMGGSSTLLTMDALNETLITLNENIGDKSGTKLIMGTRTKQILNRIANPARYSYGMSGNDVDLRTEKIITDVGAFTFEYDRFIPEGEVYMYNPSGMEYAPFTDLDWKAKDVPTKGDYTWRGMSGTFTFRPGSVPAMALIKNFSTTLANYPVWGKPAP